MVGLFTLTAVAPGKGKTYYTAKDPVSGREVDKAVAVIGKQQNGDVLYFESRQTLAAYRPK